MSSLSLTCFGAWLSATGPRRALKRLELQNMTSEQRRAWSEEARVDAILGSCRLSLNSFKCGVRCWSAFLGRYSFWLYRFLRPLFVLCTLADALRKEKPKVYLPPSLEELLAWTTLFRSPGTLSNYLGYLRTACMLANVPTQAWSLFFSRR